MSDNIDTHCNFCSTNREQWKECRILKTSVSFSSHYWAREATFCFEPSLDISISKMSDFQNTFHTTNNQHTELYSINNWAIFNHLSLAQFSQYSDSLWTGRSGDEIPVGAKFSAPIQTNRGAHPASYTMGTRSFPGVKWPGCDVNHPPHSGAEAIERVELYLYSLSGPSWPVLGQILSLAHWVIKYSVPSLA